VKHIRYKGQKYEILGEHSHVTNSGAYTTLIELWSECPTCAASFTTLATKNALRNRRDRLPRRCENCRPLALGPVGGTRCVAAAARIRGARKAARARRRAWALESLL
jgi:hypothetical protein